MSSQYKYDTTYVEHRKAVKELLNKYNFDLSKYKVSNALLDLYQGETLNAIYLYGLYSTSENRFIVKHISDSSDVLVKQIAPYCCFWYILTGLIMSTCLYLNYS